MSKPREPWWGYVKNVLRAYPDYRRELARLRSSVAITPRYNANGGGSGISMPTEDLAMRELPRKEQLRLEAVERAIAETKRLPNGIWRVSTAMPRSAASCLRVLFVTDGRTDVESGVTYVPSGLMPKKFEVANSSTYLCDLASR